MLGHSLLSRPNHCLPFSTTDLLVSKGTGRSRWPWNQSLGFHTGVHKAMGVVAMIPSSYTANGCQAIVSLMVPWWLKCLITQQVCRLNSFSANDLLLINAHLLASKKIKGSIGNDKIILFVFWQVCLQQECRCPWGASRWWWTSRLTAKPKNPRHHRSHLHL